MMHKKCIAALLTVAIASLFWAGCALTVNDPLRSVPVFEPYISVQPSSCALSTTDAVPGLAIEIAEWDKLDGNLTFQWYTFATLEDYFKDNAEPVDGEVEEADDNIVSSCTPSITPAAGKTFYFYVEVTNTNPDAIGAKSATVRSDVATISFITPGKPATPVISQNPADASYTMGRMAAIAALDVRASAASGTLMYQWYKIKPGADGKFPFKTDGTPNGTAITGATQRTYLPDLSDLGSGKNYYYVVVSNVTVNPDGTETGRTDTVSIPAIITMELGEKAAAPRIDAQPKDILYFTGDDFAASTRKLSVGASSLDRGELSYQWYSSAASTGANPTEVSGATEADYKPPKEAKFYYVEVTNTNNDVKGNKVEKLKSKIAEVKVQNSGTSSAKNATITVDPSRKQQYIRGYGGMETTWGNFFQSDESDMEKMFNPDILGYNIWRIMIPPVDTDIEKGMADITSRSYADRYYKNVQIVNKYNGYVLASPWSPPKEWKSNNSINSGGKLMTAYYKQYANYLRSYARHMASQGAPIYAVSIANEPNYAGGYDGCEWTPEEMMNFYKEVGRFTQGVRGFGGGKSIPTVLTVNGESANNPNINEAAMNNSVSNAAIDMFARHVYGDRDKRMWDYPNLNGREVWMTEHNINSASAPAFPNDWTWNYIWRFMNDIDLVIRLNNENAFVWWVVKRFYSFIGEGDAGTIGGIILPRGWGMAHYSKFTIDTTRIPVNVSGTMTDSGGTSTAIVCNTTDKVDAADKSNVNNTNIKDSNQHLDNTSVKVTAFISQDGNELSLVMWTPTLNDGAGGYALGDAEIVMPDGFIIRSASAMRSKVGSLGGGSGSVENMGKPDNVDIAADRKSAFVNLPRSQILSVKFIKD